MGDKTLIFGKYVVRTCILLFAPLFTAMLLPSALVAPTTAEENLDTGVSSSQASLSASLKYEIVDYLPTDERTLTVTTDNASGYRVFEDAEDGRKVVSVIPEYTAAHKTIFDISYMQEMTFEICDATPTPTAFVGPDSTQINVDVPETVLVDSRDGSEYLVRKLADGKCWMSENLRLNLYAGRALTSANSDVASDFVPMNDTQVTAGARWGSSQPTEEEANVDHSYNSHSTAYGNYYNWYAATAGSGRYYMRTRTARSSICPKGWMLPKSEGRNSMAELLEVYDLHAGATDISFIGLLLDAPFSFTLAGDYYYNGVTGGEEDWADYWTADVANLVAANFDVELGGMNYHQKTDGLSIRCVVRN